MNEESPADLRGQLMSIPDTRRYMLAGNATLTFVGKTTRHTYKFQRPPGTPPDALEKPVFVRYLYGPDNESSYRYLGCIWPSITTWRWAPKNSQNYPRQNAALRWIIGVLNNDSLEDFRKMEVWHEGRCGRCGRKLTVPDSVRHGYGPECIQHVMRNGELPI